MKVEHYIYNVIFIILSVLIFYMFKSDVKDKKFKVVVVGESGVGKTTIIMKIVG